MTIFPSTSYVGISSHFYLNKSPCWLSRMFKFINVFSFRTYKNRYDFSVEEILQNQRLSWLKEGVPSCNFRWNSWVEHVGHDFSRIWWWDNKRIAGGGLYIIPGVINFKPCKKIEIFLVICYFMWVVLFYSVTTKFSFSDFFTLSTISRVSFKASISSKVLLRLFLTCLK